MRDIVTKNYTFIKADITDQDLMHQVFSENNITDVIHLAAESHVDRSIADPTAFQNTTANQQTIYVSTENVYTCENITSFDIVVAPLPQIDEDQPAQIPPLVNPTRKTHHTACIARAQRRTTRVLRSAGEGSH